MKPVIEAALLCIRVEQPDGPGGGENIIGASDTSTLEPLTRDAPRRGRTLYLRVRGAGKGESELRLAWEDPAGKQHEVARRRFVPATAEGFRMTQPAPIPEPAIAGTYLLHVWLNGKEIPQSPLALKLLDTGLRTSQFQVGDLPDRPDAADSGPS